MIAAGPYPWSDGPSQVDLLLFETVLWTVADALLGEVLDPVALGFFGRWENDKTTRLSPPGFIPTNNSSSPPTRLSTQPTSSQFSHGPHFCRITYQSSFNLLSFSLLSPGAPSMQHQRIITRIPVAACEMCYGKSAFQHHELSIVCGIDVEKGRAKHQPPGRDAHVTEEDRRRA
jgi:hypothetical protein